MRACVRAKITTDYAKSNELNKKIYEKTIRKGIGNESNTSG